MARPDSQFVRFAGLAVFAVVVSMLTPASSSGQKGAPTADVNVVNTPLPVTVSAPIAATQSGAWTVGISGTPTVELGGTSAVSSADETVLIDSFSGDIQTGFTEAASGDATNFKSVRVLTNCFEGATCGNILVRVYSIVGGRSYLVEQFPMLSFVAATRVYDVIGTRVDVQLVNNSGGAVSNIGAAIFGRAN
jgi:hypothetical protein